MANFVFNCAKGQIGEYFRRVDSNDPTNAAIIGVPLSASGTEAQGQDLDTLAAVEADANFAEQTSGSWARVSWTDSDLASSNYEADDTANRFDVSLPTKSFGSPASGAITGVLICYDSDTTSGADSNIIPLVHLDASITGNGNEVIWNGTQDILRAS